MQVLLVGRSLLLRALEYMSTSTRLIATWQDAHSRDPV
jgi:hypothetical protein